MDKEGHECEVANLDERRLQRLEQAIAVTRTKLDVVGIRLEWLGRKLLSTELERAELRRTLAERVWELNLLRHRLKLDRRNPNDQPAAASACKSSVTD
ncbi:hypothetical protein [Imhoffiella purpurea]|uniref:Uncharacterized protein n=1 Tax=Imhoffiella purpurea TaxID=1249627 RepID=W9VI21_9GAMM|nr:hypothetical protein [Imhoffiella purpurea]EXJ15697.1 hypothetical protein D779_1085 [Imhoffiella purpurea]